MYILQYVNLNFQKLFLEVNILYAFPCNILTPGHLISIQSALTSFNQDQHQDNQHHNNQAKQA